MVEELRWVHSASQVVISLAMSNWASNILPDRPSGRTPLQKRHGMGQWKAESS